MVFSGVNRVGFGAMQLPGPGVYGPPRDRDEVLAVLRRAVELGVNHIDTASYYGPEVADELIREALAPYPEDLRIVSKVGARREGRDWLPALAPEEIRRQVETDLRVLGVEALFAVNLRLGTEVGAPDETPDTLGPALETLIELRADGKLRHIGLSNVGPAALEQARRETEIACVQNRYGLMDREHEDELRWCAEHDAAFVPFFPLGSAFGAAPRPHDSAQVRAVAQRLGITPAQAALAWLLHHDEHILLIPGTSSLAHLEENMAVAAISLDADTMRELDAASRDG